MNTPSYELLLICSWIAWRWTGHSITITSMKQPPSLSFCLVYWTRTAALGIFLFFCILFLYLFLYISIEVVGRFATVEEAATYQIHKNTPVWLPADPIEETQLNPVIQENNKTIRHCEIIAWIFLNLTKTKLFHSFSAIFPQNRKFHERLFSNDEPKWSNDHKHFIQDNYFLVPGW